MLVNTPTVLVGRRYQLISQVGSGGMGEVWRASDRLIGQQVALKRVLAPADRLLFDLRDSVVQRTVVAGQEQLSTSLPTTDSLDVRLSLAQEFRLLASLRHPNIISVLDYGFDENRQPYFTMELLENARTILDKGRGLSVKAQVALLVQILHALAYLHRRGIIHHDLKPGNVLVVGDQVKVLDFGLSVDRRQTDVVVGTTAGTLTYMAPEVLMGAPASEPADLYGVGVIGYELFTGEHLFGTDNIVTLVDDILYKSPDLQAAGVDYRLVSVLMRLLAKSPEERYRDAAEVITALGEATGQPVQIESTATRESFLQAARLVGRDAELASLSDVLAQAGNGHGSAWLVGGESGVGKSRLLDELRARAMVRGALVTRGQGVSEGGVPYQLWRPVLRWLSLVSELGELQAGVLKALVPDMSQMLGWDVPDAPELEPQAAQERLLAIVEEVLRCQEQPVVVILEDLEWAGSEDLAILGRVIQVAHELPLLIVGSYRHDERPDLPAILPGMQTLKLNRLTQDAVAELSVAMLGPGGRKSEVLRLLQQQTGGNALFVVEVVRALAEEAGQLDRVGNIILPEQIFTRKLQDFVARRLAFVPTDARRLLQIAAVLGRLLDLSILRTIEPDVDLDRWLMTCADLLVLEIQDGQWRFAHDKLREGLLATLSDDERRPLHQYAAMAVETVYPDTPEQAAALAYHWGKAGNLRKEGRYSIVAGEQALHSGAYKEAVKFLSRSLSLIDQSSVERAHLTRQLAEAYYGLGDLVNSREHLYEALELLGYAPLKSRLQAMSSLMREVLRQIGHRVRQPRAQTVPASVVESAHACERLAQIHYLEHEKIPGLLAVLRLLNLGEQIGVSPELTRGYASTCLAAGVVGLHSLADSYGRRALETARQLDQAADLAYVLEVTGIYRTALGRWAEVKQACTQAVEICERLGHWRWWEESLLLLAIVAYRQGEFTRSAELFQQLYMAANRRGAIPGQVWGLTGRLWSLLPMGILDETVTLLESLPHDQMSHADRICVHVALAQAYLRRGDKARAREAAGQAAKVALHTAPTSQYSFPGFAGLAEVYVALWEDSADAPWAERKALQKLAHQTCKVVHKFARVFPAGKPYAALWQGLYDWQAGKRSKANQQWQKCITDAEKLSMPYEQALAYYELGRHHLPQSFARKTNLTRAQEIFSGLGAAYDVERARRELERQA